MTWAVSPELATHRASLAAGVVALPVRLAVLLVPAAALAALTPTLTGNLRPVGWIGVVLCVFLAVLVFPVARLRQTPANAAVAVVYLVALAWSYLCVGLRPVGVLPNLAQAILLAVPVAVVAVQFLDSSGATARRKARLVGERLLRRADWPDKLDDCRKLPEVAELREAVVTDAGPALALLADPRPAVRVTALAALEARVEWRAGQADFILPIAKNAETGVERAAAAAAIAHCDDRFLVENLAGCLCDTDPLVRRVVAESLMANAKRRWGWIRYHVHDALADPLTADDGPLPTGGAALPQQAIEDLVGWTGEKGVAKRAAETLTEYYSHLLNSRAGPDHHASIKRLIADPKVSSLLRTDLTQLLGEHGGFSVKELLKLLDPAQPASVRLLAADLTLADPAVASGPPLEALRELAKLSNREIALRIASVLQKRLNLDMGLPAGPLPAKRSPEAVEVTRRVREWADVPPRDDEETPSGSGSGRGSGLRRRPSSDLPPRAKNPSNPELQT